MILEPVVIVVQFKFQAIGKVKGTIFTEIR